MNFEAEFLHSILIFTMNYIKTHLNFADNIIAKYILQFLPQKFLFCFFWKVKKINLTNNFTFLRLFNCCLISTESTLKLVGEIKFE